MLGDRRAVLARLLEDRLAVPGRNPAPDVPCAHRKPDDARPPCQYANHSRHGWDRTTGGTPKRTWLIRHPIPLESAVVRGNDPNRPEEDNARRHAYAFLSGHPGSSRAEGTQLGARPRSAARSLQER